MWEYADKTGCRGRKLGGANKSKIGKFHLAFLPYRRRPRGRQKKVSGHQPQKCRGPRGGGVPPHLLNMAAIIDVIMHAIGRDVVLAPIIAAVWWVLDVADVVANSRDTLFIWFYLRFLFSASCSRALSKTRHMIVPQVSPASTNKVHSHSEQQFRYTSM